MLPPVVRRSLVLACCALLATTFACGDPEPADRSCEADEECPDGQVCEWETCVDQPDDDCRPGETMCDDECVVTESDDDHCGACGVECGDQEICAKGFCVCKSSAVECGDECVDTETDDDHCGACGNQCGDQTTCQLGNCIGDCPDDQSMCGGDCVDVDDDPNHCGQCHNACGDRQVCDDGDCVCDDDYDECGGECVDLWADADHCGGCNDPCADGQVCNNGDCTWECPTTQSVCDDACFDLKTSTDHCGDCDNDCSTELQGAVASCDDGQCVEQCSFDDHSPCHDEGLCANLETDDDHCGDCGNTCETDIDGAIAFCDGSGSCETTCALTDHTLCEDDDVCTNLETDDDHCSQCGNDCGDGYSCVDGSCVEDDDNGVDPDDCDPDAEPFGGGEGNAVNPYRICSADQLIRVDDSDDHLDSDYELYADIDLDGVGFAPLGQGDWDDGDNQWDGAFSGTFDGQGFAIQNLELDPADGQFVGLFGAVAASGAISALTLEDVDIDGDEYVGGLAGRNDGSLTDVSTTGTVSGDETVGGLVGENNASGVIDTGWTDGDVSGSGPGIGGLVGVNEYEIVDSASSADVEGPDRVGGLVGDGSATGCHIERSRATGDVAETNGGEGFGGLIGSLRGFTDPCQVVESSATGDVDAPTSSHVGGLIGRGGFSDSPRVVDSYATGETTGASDVGGFIGAYGPDIARSYAYGDSSGQGFVGSSPTTIDDSYYNADLNSTDASGDTTGLTDDEFGDESNFDDWDFDDVWQMSTSFDRPVLQWEE